MTYASGKRSPTPKTEGLTFDEARALARMGREIRREVWVNTLRLSAGILEFTTAVQMYGSTYDRSYTPTDIDVCARDWVAA
jgi:hypothetical protein